MVGGMGSQRQMNIALLSLPYPTPSGVRHKDSHQFFFFESELFVLGGSAYQASRFANRRLTEFVARDYESQNLVCITLHPGCVKTDMADDFPESLQFILVDKAELPADTVVWLCSQRREWLSGRFVCGNWDMEELEGRKSEILERDLFKYRMTI